MLQQHLLQHNHVITETNQIGRADREQWAGTWEHFTLHIIWVINMKMSNFLTNFRKITRDFPPAAAVDKSINVFQLSEVMNQGVTAQTPVSAQGIPALRRSGVRFSASASQTVPSRPRSGIRFLSTPFPWKSWNPTLPPASFSQRGPLLANGGKDRLSQAHDKYLLKRSSGEGGYLWYGCFLKLFHTPRCFQTMACAVLRDFLETLWRWAPHIMLIYSGSCFKDNTVCIIIDHFLQLSYYIKAINKDEFP